MLNIFRMLKTPIGFYDYIWADVILIRETQKAILVEFDSRKAWFSKAEQNLKRLLTTGFEGEDFELVSVFSYGSAGDEHSFLFKMLGNFLVS